MAFWGIEVKPGKPYSHRYDDEKGRLHVSQATLVAGSSSKRSIVQCNVGDNKPIYLCSLLPEKLEACSLNLEFEEEDEVTFSVIGPHSVHLSGFFYGDNEDEDHMGDGCCPDHHEEDIMVTDSEDGDDSSDYDSEDEDDFIFDGEDDDDCGLYSHSPVRNSGVRIEEIVDEEKPNNESGKSKQAKKKKGQLSMSNDNENSDLQIVAKTRTGVGAGVPILESEDEDGFPKSARASKSAIHNSESKIEETKKTPGNKDKDEITLGKKLKRKIDAVGHDGEPTSENNEPKADTITPESEVKQKKKNKKKKVAEKEEIARESGIPKSDGLEQSSVTETAKDTKPTSEKKKEKKKKKENKKQESAATPNTEGKVTDKKGTAVEKQEKEEAKSQQVRTYPNGLVIEEVAMGKPDGKRASPGKKVGVHYIGKLKKNGKIFDSNVGRAPFKFRLGIGEVIKGWDVGVNGMRVGDKRRLTIPPAMGYGAKGCGAIPPNSWLVFDVELVDVN
ncbi:hypothetical protein ACJIZ3_009318 [Penstemon smallii]|uniref:peptidylprolyl isomerase n=1 Tax=Penstemon smallii TaxID=265156 RepID=A0ABD3TCP3_9LAMI